ncbi:hypothetical protein ACF0H5_011993 [Mactra antiquata]
MLRSMILLSSFLVLASAYNFGYNECKQHIYKAKCLRQFVRLQNENRGLRKFPAISRVHTCVQLKDNAISSFPIDLTSLSHVETLDLSGNRINKLPKNLNAMGSLEILDLSRNQIRELSSSTRFPVSLRGLLLAGNGLSSIPDGFQVPKLFVLDLSQNQFTDIPKHFCVSDQLIRVDFNDNPLKYAMSGYMGTLSRCQNANAVPFCLFTSHEFIDCDCTILDYLVNEPNFKLGSSLNDYKEIRCSEQGSTSEFAGRKIYDIVEMNLAGLCNFKERKDARSARNKASIQQNLPWRLCIVIMTAVVYRTLF